MGPPQPEEQMGPPGDIISESAGDFVRLERITAFANVALFRNGTTIAL
jgi:hypothetical protein